MASPVAATALAVSSVEEWLGGPAAIGADDAAGPARGEIQDTVSCSGGKPELECFDDSEATTVNVTSSKGGERTAWVDASKLDVNGGKTSDTPGWGGEAATGPAVAGFGLGLEGQAAGEEDGLLLRLRRAAEQHLQEAGLADVSLLDLLRTPGVEAVAAAAGGDFLTQLQTLQEAIAGSSLLEVAGSRVVSRAFMNMSAWLAPGGGWAPPLCVADFGAGPCGVPFVGWLGQGGELPAQNPADEAEVVKHRIVRWVASMLKKPSSHLANRIAADGFVTVADILHCNRQLSALAHHSAKYAFRAIQDVWHSDVKTDEKLMAVRLLTYDERIQQACEHYLRAKSQNFGLPDQAADGRVTASVDELLSQSDVVALLGARCASDPDRQGVTPEHLLTALEGAEFLDVTGDGAIMDAQVSLRGVEHFFAAMLEELVQSRRAQGALELDGELSLQWALMSPLCKHICRRFGISCDRTALEVLRRAAAESKALEVTQSGMCFRPRRAKAQVEPTATPAPAAGPEMGRSAARRVPLERHASRLRSLLEFYFEPFSLQHNRVLLAAIESQRQGGSARGYLRAAGQRPVFSLEDIRVLPRIAKVLSKYDASVAAALLAAALPQGAALPVRLGSQREVGEGRGAWHASPAPTLELTYSPDLRLVEGAGERYASEVTALVAPGPSPDQPLRCRSPGSVCVVSYCVSSDLSHPESPKAASLAEQLDAEGLDRAVLTWSRRQAKLCRQLLLHGPDVICLQGIQSLGFVEHCTEDSATWFDSLAEPTVNHLALLAEDLAPHNYGCFFAPTMKLPGSDVVCFGNAVFWRRSRFQLEAAHGLSNAAACVELSSSQGGPSILVCSSKSAAVFARDWGAAVSEVELAQSFLEVQHGLDRIVRGAELDLQPLWCGDFGTDSESLVDGLAAGAGELAPAWWSAAKSALGKDPSVTSLLGDGRALATDFVLHDQGLHVAAVLSGPRHHVSLVEFLRNGYPSDHFLQMALFVGEVSTSAVEGSSDASPSSSSSSSSGGDDDEEDAADGLL